MIAEGTYVPTGVTIEGYSSYEAKYNIIIKRLKILANQCREFLVDKNAVLDYTIYWSPKKVKIENSFSYMSTDGDRYTLRIEFTENDETIYIDGLDHYHKLLDFTINNWEQIGLESQLKFDLENAKGVREENSQKENKDLENYIVINGKKAELTEEQLEKLGINLKKHNEYFDRRVGYPYYYINRFSKIQSENDIGHSSDIDNESYEIGNYCRDKEIMEQRALHETFDRLLWRASVIAGELDNSWDGNNKHWQINYSYGLEDYSVDSYSYVNHRTLSGTYFPTRESAEDAIENIIKPFMKEHPDFVW